MGATRNFVKKSFGWKMIVDFMHYALGDITVSDPIDCNECLDDPVPSGLYFFNISHSIFDSLGNPVTPLSTEILYNEIYTCFSGPKSLPGDDPFQNFFSVGLDLSTPVDVDIQFLASQGTYVAYPLGSGGYDSSHPNKLEITDWPSSPVLEQLHDGLPPEAMPRLWLKIIFVGSAWHKQPEQVDYDIRP